MKLYIYTTECIDGDFFLFCLDSDSRPYTLCVKKGVFYFYVKTKSDHNISHAYERGEMQTIKRLLAGQMVEVIKEIESVKFFSAEMYTEHLLTHYKVYVSSYKDIKRACDVLKEKGFPIADYPKEEAKLFSDLKIKNCQWIELDEEEVKEQDFGNNESSRNPKQLLLPSNSSIKGIDNDETPPKVLICTIDAETYSSSYGIGGSIAMPNALSEKDELYCLSMVFNWSDSNTIIKKYCLCISEFDVPLEGDANMISLKTEEELYKKFSEIIREEDPDCINGYNTMGYDFEYMNVRSSLLEIPSYGRLKASNELLIEEYQKYDSRNWEGAGGTFHKYTYPLAYGRVILDTFQMVKKTKTSQGTPGALQSHKLNDVGKFFVNDTKEDMPYSKTFFIYRELKKLKEPQEEILKRFAKVCSYCVQDSVLCMKIFQKISGWIAIRESASIFLQDMNKVLTTGQTQKIFTKFLRCCEENKFAFYQIERPRLFKLKGGAVADPIVGKHSNVAVIDFASMYPTTQMAYNICMSSGSMIPPKGCTPEEYTKLTIPVEIGAQEMPADCESILENLNEEFDMQQIDDKLYVKRFFEANSIKDEYQSSFLDLIREKNGIEKIGRFENLVFYFVKASKRKGIMTIILEELKGARDMYKKRMKENKNDPIVYDMYDQRQQLVKVVMNSIYGCFGAQQGKLKFLEGSAAITYLGREAIHGVQEKLKQNGCKIIYGDTDSVMFQLPGYVNGSLSESLGGTEYTSEEFISKCKAMVDDINITLPKPMMVEFEKVMNGIFITKKKYLGRIIWPPVVGASNAKMEMIVKGAAAIRGDTTPFVRNLYTQILEMILQDKEFEEVNKYYQEQMKKLLSGKVPNEMLSVSKMLSHNYASDSAPMKIYASYLKSIGELAEPGTKIPMIMAKPSVSNMTKTSSPNSKKSLCFRLPSTNEEIDYEYYAESAKRPLDQLINASFAHLDFQPASFPTNHN